MKHVPLTVTQLFVLEDILEYHRAATAKWLKENEDDAPEPCVEWAMDELDATLDLLAIVKEVRDPRDRLKVQ